MKNCFLLLCFVFIVFSCKKSDESILIDSECYAFDIRQCQTDGFAPTISESESTSVRESLMQSWLTDNGFSVDKVKLEVGFHEGVCEACDLCPQGDRYYMQVNPSGDTTNIALAETLRLLSFELADCSVFE